MGDRVLEKLPAEIADEIRKGSDAFHVGVLGPDPFFFYRFFAPPRFIHKIDQRGKTMHHKKCGAFLMELGRNCCKQGSSQHDCDAFSYFTGFLCHYALDSTVHPYINALAAKRAGMHTAIERKLDREELARQGKRLADIMKLFRPFPNLPEIRKSMKAIYKWDDDRFRVGYRHMKYFIWIIKDQHGLITALSKVVSGVLGIFSGRDKMFIIALPYRNSLCDDMDLSGFYPLEAEAEDFAVELLTAAYDYRDGRITEEELAEKIGNRAYSGGPAKD